MKGFFPGLDAPHPRRAARRTYSCASCGLYNTARSPRIAPYGAFRERIMVVGEAPGAEEDEAGLPWQGRMGQVLQRKYEVLGIDLFEDCVSINAVNCRPTDGNGSNRAPTEHEIACCRRLLNEAIAAHAPRLIIAQGGAALEALIGHRWASDLGGITKWRGWTIPDREYNAWLCPTFHPSYVERQREVSPEVDLIWSEDLKRAFSKARLQLPASQDERECVTTIMEDGAIAARLRSLLKAVPPLLAVDIETTGLLPYNKSAHRIISVSLCADGEESLAMPFPESEESRQLLTRLLVHPRIGKIAANMRFEDVWLTVMCGITVHPWAFDTMQAAHILDNRAGITGLKFQSYVRFGVLGYDESVSPYMKSASTRSPNKMDELTHDAGMFQELLIYNGIDSLLEYRLAMLQMEELGMRGATPTREEGG